MIKANRKTLIITSLLILLPVVFGVVMWDKLPEKMPTHFGLDGTPDGWNSKGFAVFGLPLIVLALDWFAVFVTEKDNKGNEQNKKLMTLVLWICPLICIGVNAATYSWALGNEVNVKTVVVLLLGVIFTAIGNLLPKCKPNRTIGIRIKGTLSSEENWNATHRFAGKIWFAGGVLMMLCGFLPGLWMALGVCAVMLILVVIPIVYSWRFYKRESA